MNTRSKGLTKDDHEHTLIVNRREVSSKSLKDKNKKPPTASEAEDNQANEDTTSDHDTDPHLDEESFGADLADLTQGDAKPDTPYPFRRITIEGPAQSSYRCLADIPEEHDPRRDSPFIFTGRNTPPPTPPQSWQRQTPTPTREESPRNSSDDMSLQTSASNTSSSRASTPESVTLSPRYTESSAPRQGVLNLASLQN